MNRVPTLISTLSTALAWMRVFGTRRPHGPHPTPLTAEEARDVMARASMHACDIDRVFAHRTTRANTTEIVVGPQTRTFLVRGVRAHRLGCELADGALWPTMTSGYYVVSPELLFAMMAREHGYVLTALLGYELCGSYCLSQNGNGEIIRRDPLTSPERIREQLATMGLLGRQSAARKALDLVREGSASPMESRMALLSVLPRARGGMGMPTPQLNGRVELGEQERRRLGKSYLLCDLLWEDLGVALEYDSLTFHGTARELSQTLERRTVLEEKGIHVISMTGSDMHDAACLAGKAAALASSAGLRKRPYSRRALEAMAIQLKTLMGATWV